MIVDPRHLVRLRQHVSRGDLILFTGAGFSRGALNMSGAALPVSSELRETLWPLAFPGEPFDEGSQLGDVFAVARRVAGNGTQKALTDALRVDPETLPEFYRTWFSMPWARIYTLNLDDLDAAVAARFNLPRAMRSLSALTATPPPPSTD